MTHRVLLLGLLSLTPTLSRAEPRAAEVRPLAELSWADRADFGAKTAGVAELGRVPGIRTPGGHGVPCGFYVRFMRETGLQAVAGALLADPAFQADPRLRKQRLRALRKQIQTAPLPQELLQALQALQAQLPRDVALRCRPSPSGEDLEAWFGARLYDARTHRPDEGSLSRTVRQVWASLWTLRACEARRAYGLDPLQASMGVLVHPRFEGEQVDGSARSSHDRDPRLLELDVEAEAAAALTIAERIELGAAARAIHAHFAAVCGAQPPFGLTLEFKLDRDRRLVFKEARVEAADESPRARCP